MAVSPEELLRKRLGQDFEQAVSGKISEFGGLLTRAAAVRLLCKQNGIETEEMISISQAAAAKLPFSFQAHVDRIFPLQAYANGSGRSVRLHLSDAGWEATLVLWNEQTALVEGEVSSGDGIECKGAYFRGGEIWVGKNGTVKRVSSNSPIPIGKLTAGICNVEGEAREVEPDYRYLDKKSGEERKLSSFYLCNGEHCRRVVVWPSPGNEPPRVHPGDVLLLENVAFRGNELHFGSYSRMVRKKSSQEHAGLLSSASVDGESAVFEIGGCMFRLPLDDALGLLGVSAIPEGVSPKTMFLIKAQDATGRNVGYSLKDGRISWLALRP